jgi:integrase
MHTPSVFDLKKIGLDKKSGLLRYSARIVVTDDVTKKRIVDTIASKILANSIQEAREGAAKIAAQKCQAIAGVATDPTTRGQAVTVAAAWDAWTDTVKRAGSRRTYRSIGRSRVKPDMGQQSLHAVTSAQWGAWLERLRKSTRINYANGIRSAIQSLYAWAIKNQIGRVTANPINESNAFGARLKVDDPEALRKRLKAAREDASRKHLEPEELARMLAVYQRTFPQTYLLWIILCCSAVRFAEACVLERDAFDFKNPKLPRLHVYQTLSAGELAPPKGNVDRWIDLPPLLVPLIRAHIAKQRGATQAYGGEPHTFLFPRLQSSRGSNVPVVSYDTLHRHVTESKAKAGVATANATHLARHTAALLLSTLPGSAAQRQLGHATLEQTLAYGANPKGLVGQAMEKSMGALLPTGDVIPISAASGRFYGRSGKSGR